MKITCTVHGTVMQLVGLEQRPFCYACSLSAQYNQHGASCICTLCIVQHFDNKPRTRTPVTKTPEQFFAEIADASAALNAEIARGQKLVDEGKGIIKTARESLDKLPVPKTRRPTKPKGVTVHGLTTVLTALSESLKTDDGTGAQVTMPELRLERHEAD